MIPARQPIGWKETRTRLRRDRQRLRALLQAMALPEPAWLALHPPYLCVWLHRICHYFHRQGRDRWARLIWQINVYATGAQIYPNCDIGGGLVILHPAGVAFCANAGEDLTVMGLAGAGGELEDRRDVGAGPGLPLLGDAVALGAHSGVLGPTRIGNQVHISPGTIVTRDAPDRAVVSAAAPGSRPAEPQAAAPSGESSPGLPPAPITWRETRRKLRHDRARLAAFMGEAGTGGWLSLGPSSVSVNLYRVSHFLFSTGRRRLANAVWHANVFLTGADIHPRSELGEGLVIPQPAGVFIHGRAGRDLTVMAQAGVGVDPLRPQDIGAGPGWPIVEDDVELAPQAAVVGPVRVGRGARLGPGMIAAADVPPGARLEPAPARLFRRPGRS